MERLTSAPVTLTGHLERMHFSTASEAVWELQVTLGSSNGHRLTIIENYHSGGASPVAMPAARPRPQCPSRSSR